MNDKLLETIKNIKEFKISEERKRILEPLTRYVQDIKGKGEKINLNFICTHNSRRSHLAQIWAQIAAEYYQVDKVYTYSGGTEATAMFPMIGKTLEKQGLETLPLSNAPNPVYAIKFSNNSLPIIAFSKTYDHDFNPSGKFAAIMTCNHADKNCPLVFGAEERISVTYIDPKISDGTPEQEEIYKERSLEIASEMFHVFSHIESAEQVD